MEQEFVEEIQHSATVLGLESLKPDQISAISACLAGRDVVICQPTGWGKSACFILPAIVKSEREGRPYSSLVVSPLLALMRDQKARLTSCGVRSVVCSSEMDSSDTEELAAGTSTVVFATPEYLLAHLNKFINGRYCLMAVDEAHCIAEWGWEFRPSYLRLGELQSLLTHVPTMVLTATFDEPCFNSVRQVLNITEASTEYVCALPDRSELFFAVERTNGKPDVLMWLGNCLRLGKKVLVYAENTSTLAQIWKLVMRGNPESVLYKGGDRRNNNLRVVMYHDGVREERRKMIEQEIVKKDSRIRIVLSTSALGMGLDVRDIDGVVLWEAPKSALMTMQTTTKGLPRSNSPAFPDDYLTTTSRIKARSSFNVIV